MTIPLPIVAGQIVAGQIVAGVDEAGRGPLAGPVVAAAVVLGPGGPPPGWADSKALTAAAREALFDAILAGCAGAAIAGVPPALIDRLNIRGATLLAMRRAVLALPLRPSLALIDGRDVPPGLPCEGRAIVRGDATEAAIACASILAKVARDRLMVRLGAAVPGYGFAVHKGYPTAAHREALARLGPSPHHRLSFAPVRAARAAVTGA